MPYCPRPPSAEECSGRSLRRGRALGSIMPCRRAPGRDRDRSRVAGADMVRHLALTLFGALVVAAFAAPANAQDDIAQKVQDCAAHATAKTACRPSKNHADHLGPAIELSLQGAARLPRRVTARARSWRRAIMMVFAPGSGKSPDYFAAESWPPGIPRPPPRRHPKALPNAGHVISRISKAANRRRGSPASSFKSRCRDERLRRRDANQRPRHAGLRQGPYRRRPRGHGALHRRAVASCSAIPLSELDAIGSQKMRSTREKPPPITAPPIAAKSGVAKFLPLWGTANIGRR